MAPAIRLHGVSKQFRLYHEQYRSVKERLIHLGRVPSEEFSALDDVSLDIEEGETLALLGHNGSGKSTLLKCIAGIIRPTTGHIETVGRLAAMLELGTGFHPELTGRENVFMNATILGLTNREIEARFDDIVGFAELEQFIDQQVKHYSSGMYVRLGFAVAAHMDPEILLVDEVLSVGDEAFQQKCLGRIRQFQADGRTIVMVTHSAELVPRIASRAGVLDHGRLIMTGPPGEAIRTLRDRLFSHDDDHGGAEPGEAIPGRVRIAGLDLEHAADGERPFVYTGEALSVRVRYAGPPADAAVDDLVFSFAIYDDDARQLFGTSTAMLGADLAGLSGDGWVRFRVERVPFLDGRYYISVKVTDTTGAVVHDWRMQREHFDVVNPGGAVGLVEIPVSVEVEPGPVPGRVVG